MPIWPEFHVPDFSRAFPGLQSMMLWLSCIVLAASALSMHNYFAFGRPFVVRSLTTALLAYFVAAPGFFTLREFIPTIAAIAMHVFTYTAAVPLLWVLLFQPLRHHSASGTNRYLW